MRLVRILRSTVMVRVGGGWVALDEFLIKNDPCRGTYTISPSLSLPLSLSLFLSSKSNLIILFSDKIMNIIIIDMKTHEYTHKIEDANHKM